MKVIEYIRRNGLDSLNTDFGIVIKRYPEEELVVLNYHQCDSPKNEITNECRGLILSTVDWRVVCRPFDRFFNYGEQNTQDQYDNNKAYAFPKVDGSLIKIYWHNQRWHIGTRGTAFAEASVGDHGLTFHQLVLVALNQPGDEEFQELCYEACLDPLQTYIFEVTAMENRVVTRYEGYTLHFLASRHNNESVGYAYTSDQEMDWVEKLGASVKNYKSRVFFKSIEEALASAAVLKDMEEGYVVYQDGVPLCKIKSPAYVAIHHLRGEGLSRKRIVELVLTGEQEEYLKYFPEDSVHINPWVTYLAAMLDMMHLTYNRAKYIEDQKVFALEIKDLPFSSVLFKARATGKSTVEAWKMLPDSYKQKFLLENFDEYTS